MCRSYRKWSRDNLTNLGKKWEAVKYTKGYFLRVMPQEKEEEEEAIDINITREMKRSKTPEFEPTMKRELKERSSFRCCTSSHTPPPLSPFPQICTGASTKKS